MIRKLAAVAMLSGPADAGRPMPERAKRIGGPATGGKLDGNASGPRDNQMHLRQVLPEADYPGGSDSSRGQSKRSARSTSFANRLEGTGMPSFLRLVKVSLFQFSRDQHTRFVIPCWRGLDRLVERIHPIQESLPTQIDRRVDCDHQVAGPGRFARCAYMLLSWCWKRSAGKNAAEHIYHQREAKPCGRPTKQKTIEADGWVLGWTAVAIGRPAKGDLPPLSMASNSFPPATDDMDMSSRNGNPSLVGAPNARGLLPVIGSEPPGNYEVRLHVGHRERE